ncbi:TPA: hypothetical protein N0F65_000711 [Lagenidium giganteum]|uniref:Uncharacterized protein n=1 Tax=Lagenidium giganteum TaxID=4803 RepID=A0AAV2ZC62_9STRA|nr:TPA: hypothetical protein N0F65_000711 [Lagenidium giganteum]
MGRRGRVRDVPFEPQSNECRRQSHAAIGDEDLTGKKPTVTSSFLAGPARWASAVARALSLGRMTIPKATR